MNLEEYLIDTLKLDKDKYKINIEFNKEKNIIYIYLEDINSKIMCPMCSNLCFIYDRKNKQWRHTDLIDYEVYVIYNIPRIKCNNHGIKQAEVLWAKPKHDFTIYLENQIVNLSKIIPNVHIAKLLKVHDTKIGRIVRTSEYEKK